MTEAYVFDAVRTPRGKGKKDGALYSVKPVQLIAGLLNALQTRNDLDTSQVDDIVLGCVTPVGDQGADIAKTAAMVADWDVSVAGVQLNRFCASGLEAVNLGAMKVRSGFEDLVVVGGVESMSRVPMGSDGGAWAQDPATNSATVRPMPPIVMASSTKMVGTATVTAASAVSPIAAVAKPMVRMFGLSGSAYLSRRSRCDGEPWLRWCCSRMRSRLGCMSRAQ